MKIIHVNCSRRNEYGGDPRSYDHYLSDSENKACSISVSLIAVHIYGFINFQSFIHYFTGLFEINIITSPQLACYLSW